MSTTNATRRNPDGLFYLHYTLTPRPSIIVWVEHHYKYFNDYDSLLKYKSKIMDSPLIEVLENGQAEFKNGVLVPIKTN